MKKLRKENNLTQLALQLKTGIDQAVLSKYETGERVPTVENLCILADYFGTSLDFLMDRTEERTPYMSVKKSRLTGRGPGSGKSSANVTKKRSGRKL